MGDPGYGPLCGELERAYRLSVDLSRQVIDMSEGAERDAVARQLEAARARIQRCEERLLVVSLGQEAPCELRTCPKGEGTPWNC